MWFEPGTVTPPAPGGVSAVALAVDLAREEARITNVGDQRLDLGGWSLLSVQGMQRFDIPPSVRLDPNQFLLITSGPRASQQPPFILRWDTKHIWNNDGNPAELYDRDGHLVTRVE